MSFNDRPLSADGSTPYCITIDNQTMEDNTVTIRERDSMQQYRVAIDEIINKIR